MCAAIRSSCVVMSEVLGQHLCLRKEEEGRVKHHL